MDDIDKSSLPLPPPDTLGIYIPDRAYGEGDEETYSDRSASFRQELEEEHGLSFHETNIGPGADLPAFVTFLTYAAPTAVAVFFLGKHIEDGIDGWQRLAERVRAFRKHNPSYDRQAATVVAIDKILDHFGRLPSKIVLVGYQAFHIADAEEVAALNAVKEIGGESHPLNLSMVIHVFQIAADDRHFIVSINGNTVSIREIA